MTRLTEKLATKGRKAAKKAFEKIETKVYLWQGRKVVGRKVETTARVSKKAAKAGLIAGALAAAGVVRREVMKGRRHD